MDSRVAEILQEAMTLNEVQGKTELVAELLIGWEEPINEPSAEKAPARFESPANLSVRWDK